MTDAHEHPHPESEALDYHKISGGIFIGTNQCCAMMLSEALRREGITADISLESDRLDNPFGAHMYLWLPTEDHTPPSPDQLSLGVCVLGGLVRQKRKVYVHCKNGHGRAPTLVAAYFISLGLSPEDAFAHIKERRPSVHLQESQRQALVEFATRSASA